MSNIEVQRSLGRIEANMENVLKRLGEVKEENKVLSSRINKLEKAYWKFTGLSAGAMALFSLFAPKLLSAMGL